MALLFRTFHFYFGLGVTGEHCRVENTTGNIVERTTDQKSNPAHISKSTNRDTHTLTLIFVFHLPKHANTIVK